VNNNGEFEFLYDRIPEGQRTVTNVESLNS
jgi:hypothetical protein